MRALFIFAIFLGSALLFLVQPMVAKLILPRFGGAPAVWTASLLFFQASLLLGYLYAHAGSKLAPRIQAGIHVFLIGLVVLTLPFSIEPNVGAVGAGNPTWAVLRVLAGGVGLPFILVSAGAPMLQRWFSRTADPGARDPYFLYAASNVGSMLGLLAYPLLVEPNLTLTQQAQFWKIGYIMLAGLLAVTALAGIPWKANSAPESESPPAATPGCQLRPRNSKLLWIVLAAVPASLLTGVTNYVTSNIAPMPLLWVIPLALYLLTFILAFARNRKITSAQIGRWLPLLATPLALVLVLEATTPLAPLAGLHLFVFFVAAWMCHTRLVESRPGASHLTAFYLWISVGGVIGGAFNALLAPLIFKSLAEYPIAIIAALLLRPGPIERPRANSESAHSIAEGRPSHDRVPERKGSAPPLADWIFPVGLALLTFGFVLISRALGMAGTSKGTMVSIGVPVILAFLAADRPLRFGLALGVILLVSNLAGTASTGSLAYIDRSFFGVHRVTDDGESYSLTHGVTRHGRQFKDAARRDIPLTYYSRSGPIGQIFGYLNRNAPPRNVALVGLGVGTLASYGLPGESMTYFEIDPVVDSIAHDTRYFSYIQDSRAKVNVVLGDARLTLAQSPDKSFDLIVLDAFSSDAIPIHLLTREAIQIYLQKLKPGGILAFHISNNYLDLKPVLSNVAGALGLSAVVNEDNDISEPGKEASTWVAMSADALKLSQVAAGWERIEPDPKSRIWTDDYSNIVGALKR